VDGKGRCRCIRKGQACKPSQTCCNGRECVDGVCGGAAKDVCMVCASGCKYTSVSAAYAGEPAGTVIPIAAGRYGTGIAVTKSVTLKACNGVSGVVLYPDGSVTTDYYGPPQPVIIKEEPTRTVAATMKLIGLTLEPSAPAAAESLIEATDWGVATDLSFELTGCDLSGTSPCMAVTFGSHVVTNTTIHDCTTYGIEIDTESSRQLSMDITDSRFINNSVYGAYIETAFEKASRANHPTTITNTTFSGNGAAGAYIGGGIVTITGCTAQGNGATNAGKGGGFELADLDVTITDTSISGNQASDWGGGLSMAAGNSLEGTLTLAGSTVVTGNTAPAGAGLAVDTSVGATITVTGASTSSVYGNSGPDQCALNTVRPVNWQPVASCAY
ncbi:MAG: right-handed parallel beta-helix repeat-containing protein, partial [Thermomicrobiales bacterium]